MDEKVLALMIVNFRNALVEGGIAKSEADRMAADFLNRLMDTNMLSYFGLTFRPS